jgi:ribosomal protein S18 acetylase RimI-like enzyme
MSETEFQQFREYGLAHFAELWPSTEIARREFDRALPEGLLTPGQHLLTIAAEGAAVGFAWLKVIERAVGPEAFLLDFAIYPEHRRRGHARRALQALEAYVRDLGLPTLALSVQDHNAAAKALYAQAGFAATFIRMSKTIGAA